MNKINQYIENIKKEIKYFIIYTIMANIYSFTSGVSSILFWLPIIYKDKDWDIVYLYKIMEIKIKKMREYFINRGVAVHSKKEIRNMIIAENLLKRIIKEEYDEYFFKKYTEKWGDFVLNTEPFSGTSPLFKERIIADKDKKQERKDFHKIIDHERYMLKQDLELFSNIFKKESKKWWD